ncbi:MAG: MotA/TolQ/ExbB proton channel family protein [bacterium]|nr:MotA/TolQ/ExbB proton channel family protein [bacterium]
MSSDTKKAACQIGIAMFFLVGLVLAAENLAQGADVPAGTKEAAEVQGPQNVLDLIMAGGYIMIPIGLCSILAIAVAVERFISLTRDKLIPHEFSESLRGSFSGGRKDYVAAMAYCEDTPCPISNIFKAGISRAPQGNEAMEKAIEDAGAREVHKMKRSLKPLSVIARVAPLLGLLGTVYGMIAAFQSASAMGVGKADRLATGIYEALVTTASGLTLAIPVVIVYEILCHRVDSIVDHMDDQAIEFLEYTAYGQDEKRTAEQD